MSKIFSLDSSDTQTEISCKIFVAKCFVNKYICVLLHYKSLQNDF